MRVSETAEINFEKAGILNIDTIFSWLAEPHVIEFWDNSQAHKDDILNFIYNRPQTYFAGTTTYWMGYRDEVPYAFILADRLEENQPDLSLIHRAHMSEMGHTVSVDFMIGNKDYLGCGLAAQTLSEFISFYKRSIDQMADAFFIDPDENNPKAMHVYTKAGFEKVGSYTPTQGAFIGHKNDLMVKRI